MTKWRRCADWVGSQVEDQYVMIHVESGRYMALNETATEAWRLLETPHDEATLTAALMTKFDVDAETCARSVPTLLGTMTEAEMIEPAD